MIFNAGHSCLKLNVFCRNSIHLSKHSLTNQQILDATQPTNYWIEKQTTHSHCLQEVYNLEKKKDTRPASGSGQIRKAFLEHNVFLQGWNGIGYHIPNSLILVLSEGVWNFGGSGVRFVHVTT